jgi:hypothetical protein
MDTSKINKLGWSASISLYEGLKKTLKEYSLIESLIL